MKQNRVMLTT